MKWYRPYFFAHQWHVEGWNDKEKAWKRAVFDSQEEAREFYMQQVREAR